MQCAQEALASRGETRFRGRLGDFESDQMEAIKAPQIS
jgi:hypothetical protein